MTHRLFPGAARRLLALLLVWAAILALPASGQASMVRLTTSQGIVDIELYDSEAPLTVANFLGYVQSGAYDNSFFHRSVPGFIIQGGGYFWSSASNEVQAVTAGPAVANEFSPSRSNLRGTIAMAKVANDPDSATSQWFINLADNSANLDTQNGGFTVFGRVVGNGMSVADNIAALPVRNAGGAFSDLPLRSIPASGVVQEENLVMVYSVRVLEATTDADRLFNFLEQAFPEDLAPSPASSASLAGYYYRYYPSTNAYVAAAGGMLYYLGPLTGNGLANLGNLTDWLPTAAGAGY